MRQKRWLSGIEMKLCRRKKVPTAGRLERSSQRPCEVEGEQREVRTNTAGDARTRRYLGDRATLTQDVFRTSILRK
jgi:hypothetical protein